MKIKGIYKLIRIYPLFAWTFSALLIGMGYAIEMKGFKLSFSLALLGLVGSMLVHGLITHSLNDITDWITGTDKINFSAISGGTKVIRDGDFSINQLHKIAILGLVLSMIIALYISSERPYIILLYLLGIFASITYSVKPFMFSYRPFIGEMISCFPTMPGLIAGFYYIFTDEISSKVIIYGIVYGLISIAWVMQHHINDIYVDINANPPKYTSVAYMALFNREYAKIPPLLALTLAIILAALFIGSIIYITSIFIALICVYAVMTTDINKPKEIMRKEILMINMSILLAGTVFFILLLNPA